MDIHILVGISCRRLCTHELFVMEILAELPKDREDIHYGAGIGIGEGLPVMQIPGQKIGTVGETVDIYDLLILLVGRQFFSLLTSM